VELSEEEMSNMINKNFEEYVSKIRNDGSDEPDTEETKADDKKKEQIDLSLYKRMNKNNGKSFSDMFYSLLIKVFDQDIAKVEEHFVNYLD